MKAMDILRRCRSAASDISRTQQRIAQRRDALTCIAAPQIRADGTDRSARSSDKTSELMADIDGLERALEQRRNQQQAEIVAALVLLDCLPETDSGILYRYYIKRDSVPSIAAAMGFTDGYIRKVKADAESRLDSLQEARVAAALPAWYMRWTKAEWRNGCERTHPFCYALNCRSALSRSGASCCAHERIGAVRNA